MRELIINTKKNITLDVISKINKMINLLGD